MVLIYSSWVRRKHANNKAQAFPLLFSDAQQFLGVGGVRLLLAMLRLYDVPSLVLNVGTTVSLALQLSAFRKSITLLFYEHAFIELEIQ